MGPKSMEVIVIECFEDHTKIPNNFTGIVKYPRGGQCWYLKGESHREDGPAMMFSDGHRAWFLNGKLHRVDGPAVIESDGTKKWYLNGVQMTPMELFDHLSYEQKEKVLWDLNQWK